MFNMNLTTSAAWCDWQYARAAKQHLSISSYVAYNNDISSNTVYQRIVLVAIYTGLGIINTYKGTCSRQPLTQLPLAYIESTKESGRSVKVEHTQHAGNTQTDGEQRESGCCRYGTHESVENLNYFLNSLRFEHGCMCKGFDVHILLLKHNT
jgi:hypothetical protein